ncbi:MAG: tRNA dihydrouridine synthase DusB [Pseudohongiellaceae bacterium]
MINIGPYQLKNNLFLAPMVGISDLPFREICAQAGAGLTVAEMLTSNAELWQNERNRLKRVQPENGATHVVQIAGSDPELMAQAAAMNAELGADCIDINMGCPAKKVLQKAAGSALLKDRELVERILKTVVARVAVPVTLKIRTGWSPETRNGVEIAKLAEDCGIRLLTVHGRTRECRFKGQAEYDTIAAIKDAISIPVIANGDIDSPQKAARVLGQTQADGLMIGRSAQGRPWIFKEIEHYLSTQTLLPAIDLKTRIDIIFSHLMKLHSFYGDVKGVWYARKHVAAYVKELSESREFMKQFNTIESPAAQLDSLFEYFTRLDDGLLQDQGAEAA